MNIKRILLPALAWTLPLAGAMAQQWSTNTLPSGLVAWWSGEGNALDSAGQNHGALRGGVSFPGGLRGQCFRFDGASGYIDVSNTPSLDFVAGDFTISGWLRFASLTTGPQEVFHKVVGTVPNDQTYFLEKDDGLALRFMVRDGAGNQNDFSVAAPLVTGVWYHVCAVRAGNTNRIYLNGSMLGEQVAGNQVNTGTGGAARIGRIEINGVPNLTRFFSGDMDDLCLFNRALTATEIARLALSLPGANGFWGLKTHDPTSQPPTTLFWFDENGTGYRELPRVKLAGADIEADGLAMSPRGELFAFQVNTGGGSRLLSLDPSTAVATAIGPVLTGRNIRGATFTLSGRLLAFDYALRELLEINPATGLQIGAAVALSTNLNANTTAGDLTQMPDSSLLFAYHEFLYRLDPRTGTLTQLHEDNVPFPDGYIPYCCGIACVPGSSPVDKLFGYEASEADSVYCYLPSTNFARTLLVNNVVPSYNAGRGDLAGLPAAQVELLGIEHGETGVTLRTVCRGGLWAEVIFTDDLSAPNWQPVPGTAGWVPYTPGAIATPMTWTKLPTNAPHRLFRVRVK